MAATTSTPGRFGAALQTPTTTTLAAMSAKNLTPGTFAWVAELNAFFKLTLSTASLVSNEVVAVANIDGMRWIVVPEFTAADSTLIAMASGSGGLEVYGYSNVVDFAATPAGGYTMRLTKAGFYFVPTRLGFLYVTGTGTASGNLVLSIGNNVNENNVVPSSTFSAASINAIIAAGIPNVSNATVAAPAAAVADAATPITLKITTAIGGVTALTGRLVLFGAWIPV